MNTRTSRLRRSPASAALAATMLATLLMGCNKAPDDAVSASVPPITMGTQIDDTVITGAVKQALLADPAVKSFELQVETRKGIVQLSGFVETQAQIDQALVVTRGVSGVNSVENGVTLKAGSSTIGGRLDDTAITGRVKTALLGDPDIKSLDISVLTVQGAVQLTGFVNSQGQIDRATKLAAAAEGASSVKNELMVKQ